MLHMIRRSVGVSVLALGFAFLAPAGIALAASPVPIGIDGLMANHNPMFRTSFTFTYNASSFLMDGTTAGRYKSFIFRESTIDTNGGASLKAHNYTDSPDDATTDDILADLDTDYFPVLDRVLGGSVFDPSLYELQVEFRPLVTGQPPPLQNAAPFFNVTIDQHDGFMVDTVDGTGKRAGEQIGYQIGGTDVGMNLNAWHAANVQGNGYATWTMPMDTPTFTGKTFMYEYGNGAYRTANVVTGTGDPLDTGGTTDGADFNDFEGNAIPAPNGAVNIDISSPSQAEFNDLALHIEVKSIRVVPINPNPNLHARMDGESGVSVKFNSPFERNFDDEGFINVDGTDYDPLHTNKISRFDENGITNIILNTDDDDNSAVFGQWQVADYQTFDGTDAFVRIRAKLTEALDENHTETLTLTLKDLDGNDQAAGQGAEEWTSNLDLTQFNLDNFVTVDIPLNTFSLDATADQFTNEGDGLITDFNLYYLGGFISADSGLIDLEIEYIEVRTPAPDFLVGDYNDDGKVSAADYTVWRDHVGANSLTNRDPNNGGPVDQDDYDSWIAHYGETMFEGAGAGFASAAVPEPGSLLLVGLAICFGGLLRLRSS